MKGTEGNYVALGVCQASNVILCPVWCQDRDIKAIPIEGSKTERKLRKCG